MCKIQVILCFTSYYMGDEPSVVYHIYMHEYYDLHRSPVERVLRGRIG